MTFRMIQNLKARVFWGTLAAAAFALLLPRPSPGQSPPLNFSPISQPGFGDRQNSYSWSMAWFNGKLYVGTNRDWQCVENATIAYYFPIVIPLQAIFVNPLVPCPLDPADLDLRAEIWRYTPDTGAWDMIFQSDVLPNPKAPGKSVARDIGYRDMAVFTEPDGTQALYIVGCTAREYTPGLPPPRILRMTLVNDPVTGVHEVFQPIPQDPGTFMANINAITFRATAVYNGRFYVTASPSEIGDGYILESATPWLGNNSFRQVTLTSLLVYELSVFNGFLYIGAGDQTNGYSVWKTNATGSPPYTLTPVVTGGAGRGPVMTSVVSMHPYQGRLYVGSAGWFSTLLPSCELIRINPDDTWELVVGNPRLTSAGLVFPLSGLPDGFGNPFNAHIWRLNDYGGMLYAGTNDDSWGLMNTPLAPYFQSEFGFDLFASQDGVAWTRLTRNGFGDEFDFGVRCLVPTPLGLFLGSVDYVEGTIVMLGTQNTAQSISTAASALNASGGAVSALRRRRPTVPLARQGVEAGGGEISGAKNASRGAAPGPRAAPTPAGSEAGPSAPRPPAPPARLQVETFGKAAVLSWEPEPGAVQYRIYRSAYRRADLGFLLGIGRQPGPEDEVPQDGVAAPGTFTLPGPFVPIGTTTKPIFQDRRIINGRTYAYYVQAEDKRGQASGPSNTMTVPNFAQPATFDHARATLGDLVTRDQAEPRYVARLLDLLEQSREAAAKGDLDVARERLTALRDQTTRTEGGVLKPWTAENLRLMVAKLERRVGLARSGAISLDALTR